MGLTVIGAEGVKVGTTVVGFVVDGAIVRGGLVGDVDTLNK